MLFITLFIALCIVCITSIAIWTSLGPGLKVSIFKPSNQIAFYVTFAVFTGFETNNRYRVLNSVGQDVYFAVEGMKLTLIILFILRVFMKT